MDPDALYSEVVEKYARHLNPGLARLMSFAGFGVEMQAEGCCIFDHEGRRYLDCLGGYGVFALGHRHPRVVEAVKRQLDLMPLSGKAFFNKPQADLAERLTQIAPRGLSFAFFCNSGTEATEGALKFAKAATGRSKIVSTLGGFHGKTIGALSATGRKKYRDRFDPLMPDVVFVPFGEIGAAEDELDDRVAAMIVEPIQGEGGIILPPEGYLSALKAACERRGALLIVDEVQTGLGRTGLMFGCDREGVSPDLMTLAKALGGGVMPIGAILGTERVWDSVFGENPLVHTSTFGGSELACAAALATLDVIQSERLADRAARVGAIMLEGLCEVQSRHDDLIADVRGAGLMIGVEFAMDEVGELTVAHMMKGGVCAAYTLNNPRVLRFEPPLVIGEDDVAFACRVFGEAVAETAEMLSALA